MPFSEKARFILNGNVKRTTDTGVLENTMHFMKFVCMTLKTSLVQ
jgi:hypothetical protein